MTAQVRRSIRRFLALFRVGTAESDLAREIKGHLQLLEDDFVAKGMSREDAHFAARRAFGGVEQAKELQRDARSFRYLAGWSTDLTLGVRMLVKSPGLTVIAVVALAVAFGAGATYLQFINGMMRPSLPFAGGDRLIGIITRDLEKNALERRNLHDYRAWREQLTLIEDIGASQDVAADVETEDGRAASADGVRITPSAFRLVPASPLTGRPLVDADENAASPPVAVIGEALWESRFNRDPAILGRTVTIAKTRHTIVGVMPRAFGFPVNQNLWIPFRDDGVRVKRGEGPPISVVGRLAPGVTLDAAQAELAAVTMRAASADPLSNQRLQPEVRTYVASLRSSLDVSMQMMFLYMVNLAFIALLLLCAANVATLVFGRAVTREGEITVRTALGASRGRIVSQLVAEAAVLASAAAVAGLGFASYALGWVRRAWEQGQGSAMPFWWSERLTLEMFLYTALLVIIAALVIGGVPALKATGPEMQTRLKDAGAGSTMKFGGFWTSVIVLQVAFTVVFLVSVVSLGWTMYGIVQQYNDVAFQRGDYLAAQFEPNTDGEPDATATYRHREAFLRRLRQAPAVANATYTNFLPGSDSARPEYEFDNALFSLRVSHIGPDFFETFGRELIAGRLFTPAEIESGAKVAVVDESFVRFALGQRSAVGQQVREVADSGAKGEWIEIIGVTTDISTSARKSIKDAQLYLPIGAIPPRPVTLVVHSQPGYRSEGLGQVAAALRKTAADGPADTRVSLVRTMEASGEGDVVGYLFTSLTIVGAVALLLSTAGIYALISFTLARRTREIGIRTALGASPRRIITGILWKALLQIGLGVAAGIVPGVLMVAFVSTESGRNGIADGITIGAAVAGFVLTVAAVSCTLPLRRALRVDPTEALRVT
jgi:putative ABC transport system permease protein